MNHERRKSAILRLNQADGALPERRTYVCLGIARGGTSAVAGVMQRLGLFIGNALPNNYEDPEFAGKPPSHMNKVIATRNEVHEIWGWKFPSAANYLENLFSHLTNPHLIVVHRDMAATMKAHMRWHKRGPQLAAHDILLQQQRNWFLVERWQVPTALVSYEKAVLAPETFVREMADFLGQPCPEGEDMAQMIAFLEPGSYK